MKIEEITKEGFIKVAITQQLINKAIERQKATPINNKYSFLNGKGNFIGFLGEELYKQVFSEATHSNTTAYDFIHNGEKIEIKSKRRSIPAVGYLDCDLCYEHYKGDVDKYVCISIHELSNSRDESGNYAYGYILGFLKKEELDSSKVYKTLQGSKQGNGITMKKTCLQIKASDLTKYEK